MVLYDADISPERGNGFWVRRQFRGYTIELIPVGLPTITCQISESLFFEIRDETIQTSSIRHRMKDIINDLKDSQLNQ